MTHITPTVRQCAILSPDQHGTIAPTATWHLLILIAERLAALEHNVAFWSAATKLDVQNARTNAAIARLQAAATAYAAADAEAKREEAISRSLLEQVKKIHREAKT